MTSHELEEEFRRIQEHHREALVLAVARMSLPGSITRVFRKGTKDTLLGTLVRLPVGEMTSLTDGDAFDRWYEARLETVASAILRGNPDMPGSRIHPGYKWGHAAKILSVFLHNLVSYSRYFSDEDAARIEPLLHCPIDGIILKRLKDIGAPQPWSLILQLDSPDRYRLLQSELCVAAAAVGVPRVWLDDNWAIQERA